ncbi:SRPBCC family protein [Chitinophaga sp. MM2321]|uniref:SRPBCC family protein n=1 Tax=Chitinophaga sp. MM2321 TaxID=3137178 RepID=UPI0032D5846F
MKILKRILLVIVTIIVIALITALFIKKDYTVEREITINKPAQEVFAYISQLKNQDAYSVWNKLDPNMKKNYSGTDGTVGFIMAWDSDTKEAGKGEQEILKITPGERMDTKLRFKAPMEGEADAYMITEPLSENQTTVKWGFSSEIKYPFNLFLLFMDIKGMIGKDLQTGLDNLKAVLEKQ